MKVCSLIKLMLSRYVISNKYSVLFLGIFSFSAFTSKNCLKIRRTFAVLSCITFYIIFHTLCYKLRPRMLKYSDETRGRVQNSRNSSARREREKDDVLRTTKYRKRNTKNVSRTARRHDRCRERQRRRVEYFPQSQF